MALNLITHNLWLGSYQALAAQKQLRSSNITHILSALSADITGGYFESDANQSKLSQRVKDFTHFNLTVDDVEDENIMQYFGQTNEFIENALSKGEGVLVHCMAGISRSSTIVCAYLMRKNFWTPEEALEFVRSKRPIANPNPSFWEQLELYYQCGFEVSDNKQIYRQWLLKKQAEEATVVAPNPLYSPNSEKNELGDKSPSDSSSKKCFQVLPALLQRMGIRTAWEKCRLVVDDRELALDDPVPSLSALTQASLKIRRPDTTDVNVPPSILSTDQVSDLQCKKCRQLVATSHQFILHTPMLGSKGQPTRNGMATVGSSLDPACTSYFVEPVNWMRPELEQGLLEGKLACPKCSSKLGAYRWQGAKCSCGTWVTPGITIQRARVDEVKRVVKAKA